MKNNQLSSLLVIVLLLIPGVIWAKTAATSFIELSNHYEAIRQALLTDSMEGVTEHGQGIQDLAQVLLEDFDAAKASIPKQDAANFKTTLEEIQSAASDLSSTDRLTSAREVFFTLTKPMARYRKLTGDQDSVIAYCPMAQKSWIQPEGEIGNPYFGQEMPKCGDVVEDS
jgi:hypothetical protein